MTTVLIIFKLLKHKMKFKVVPGFKLIGACLIVSLLVSFVGAVDINIAEEESLESAHSHFNLN